MGAERAKRPGATSQDGESRKANPRGGAKNRDRLLPVAVFISSRGFEGLRAPSITRDHLSAFEEEAALSRRSAPSFEDGRTIAESAK